MYYFWKNYCSLNFLFRSIPIATSIPKDFNSYQNSKYPLIVRQFLFNSTGGELQELYFNIKEFYLISLFVTNMMLITHGISFTKWTTPSAWWHATPDTPVYCCCCTHYTCPGAWHWWPGLATISCGSSCIIYFLTLTFSC